MEEVWLCRYPGDDSSLHLQDFPETPKAWLNPALGEKWVRIMRARKSVTARIEVRRTAKEIGSSLEAAPRFGCADDETFHDLQSIDFGEVCITAPVKLELMPTADRTLSPGQPYVGVDLALGHKCERCWKVLPDVGTHKHPGTCKRCNDALG
jgi:isoleucyl-tRNA synthetase